MVQHYFLCLLSLLLLPSAPQDASVCPLIPPLSLGLMKKCMLLIQQSLSSYYLCYLLG
uniref:Uncharacterized protein n=1 Tax=Arundo donax TaxID=35708 RepID=A0A0A9GXN4_ARUDO